MILQFKNNHAIRATLLVLLIFLLLDGCSNKNTNNDLEFTFDDNNNYTGFKNTKKMSVSDAIKNGYLL